MTVPSVVSIYWLKLAKIRKMTVWSEDWAKEKEEQFGDVWHLKHQLRLAAQTKKIDLRLILESWPRAWHCSDAQKWCGVAMREKWKWWRMESEKGKVQEQQKWHLSVGALDAFSEAREGEWSRVSGRLMHESAQWVLNEIEQVLAQVMHQVTALWWPAQPLTHWQWGMERHAVRVAATHVRQTVCKLQ